MKHEHRKSVTFKKRKRELIIAQLWTSIKSVVECVVTCVLFLWKHNPVKVIAQRQRRLYFVENYDGIMIKPKFRERLVDLFLTDYHRKQRLLRWVHRRLRTPEVHDFTTCWQDGTVLCALLESICPGVCPSYHLLSHLNMVKNCRLGIKLANKYLYVPMDLLTPEEMAIAKKESEFKIIQYISMIKWASQNIKEKWSSLHESLIAAKTGRCFAKGSGLRNGIVGKRSKFTIVVSDTIGVFNLLVEVRGPNNEYFGEQIVSLHQAQGVLDQTFDKSMAETVKYLEDGVGNTFVRKKIPSRNSGESTADLMCLGFQCGEEGTFYVTFVPRRVGIHAVTVKWQNNHVENSPFRIKVYKASNVSTKSLKGAQEKRVIYDSLSVTTIPSHSEESFETIDQKEHIISIPELEHVGRPENAIAKSKAYSKGRQLTVTGRRVLRRIITRNGEDIVIEEAISPSLSRQSSITDNSDDDNRYQRRERDEKRHSPLPGGTTFSNNTGNGKQAASYPLGTVLEEKQNSKDNLFKNIDLSEVVRSSSFQQTLHEFQKGTGNVAVDEPNRGNQSKRSDVTEPEVDSITSQRDPLVRYKCTELNEHNILELKDKNDEADDTTGSRGNDGNDGNDSSSTSFWFTQPLYKPETRDVDRNPVKRSPLQRTMSIHGYNQKTAARRTTSDGTMYKLRRSIVSYAASDLSETSSEISSDDKQSGNEDDIGVAGHALKLLQSNSLKKACMYISEKAFSNGLSDDDDDVTELPFPVKTKLRATRSLPIIKKSGQALSKDLESGKRTQKDGDVAVAREDLPLITELSSEDRPRETRSLDTSVDLQKDLNEACVNIYITDGHGIRTSESNSSIYKSEAGFSCGSMKSGDSYVDTNTHVEASEYKTSFVSRHEQKIFSNEGADQSGTPDGVMKEKRETRGAKWYHTSTLHKDIRPSTTRDTRVRGNLTRQWKVYCHKSSHESSSDKDNNYHVENSDSVAITGEKSRGEEVSRERTPNSMSPKSPFRSIFIQSNDENGSSFTREVVIVVPKAKVDKQTQVSYTEITRETGWDVVEGVYLLLRRISLNVPLITTSSPSPISDMSLDKKAYASENELIDPRSISISRTHSSTSQSSKTKSDWSASNNPSTNLLKVPTDNRSEEEALAGLSDTSSNHRAFTPSTHSHQLSTVPSDDVNAAHGNDNDNDENQGYLNNLEGCENLAAYEISHSDKDVMSKHEAVDEWFRRNESILKVQQRQLTVETVDSGFDDNPTHFNRHARYSLPSLRTVNGHVRLHRRPYRGRIPLDPRLVNSGSSQSMSIDNRELGNEADDELLFNSSTEHIRQGRAHRRKHRLQNREDSVSFSDSEINQRRHFIRKRHFGARGQHMTILQSRDVCFLPPDGVETAKVVDQPDSSCNDVAVKPARKVRKRIVHMDSFDGADDDLINDIGEPIKTPDNERIPVTSIASRARKVSRKDMVARGSTTASSIDSNYCGFGISKPKRSALLSIVGDFQNLCTTAEVPDESMSVASKGSVTSENISENIDNNSLDRNDDTQHELNDSNAFYVKDMKENVDILCDNTDTSTDRESGDDVDNDIQQNDGSIKEAIINNLNLFANDDFDNEFSEGELVELYENSLRYLQADLGCNFESFSTDEPSSAELQRFVDSPIVNITNRYECNGKAGDNTNVGNMYLPIVNSTSNCEHNRMVDNSKDLRIGNVDKKCDSNRIANGNDNYESINIPMFEGDTKCKDISIFDVGSDLDEHLFLFDDSSIEVDIDDCLTVEAIHVDGAGLHHGLVGDSNSFQVWTENISTGSLSVHVTGARSHMVTETSILYTGDNLYEVSYGVTHPGVYKIYVKWDEENIPNSPFICEVTM